jgi:glycosyltransferase involved in cell wall biosynthesis
MDKKKILVILTRPPYPPIDGTRVTILYNVLSGLSKKFSVSLCFITLEDLTPEQTEFFNKNFDSVKHLKISKLRFYLKSLLSFLTRYPMQTYGHYISEADEWLKKELKNYDGVFIQTIRLGKYFENADQETRRKTSLHFQDAFSLNYQTAKKLAPFYWRMIYRLEERKVRNYETELFNHLTHFTIVSERDKQHILSNYKENKKDNFSIIQIPFGVRDSLTQYPKQKEKTGLVFIGNLLYPPNYDGVKYFCDNIWDKLREKFPDLTCTIIGKGKEQFKHKYEGIEFPGFVDDPFPILCKSKIFIAPIRFGAGMITKIVEGMALNLPVITTPVCAEGVSGAENNKNIVITDIDNISGWVNSISRLLTDNNYCSSIADSGFKLVSENYLTSIVEQRWIKHFEKIINK